MGVSEGCTVSVTVGVWLGGRVWVAVPVGVPVQVLNGVKVCEGVQVGVGERTVGVALMKSTPVAVGMAAAVSAWRVAASAVRFGVGVRVCSGLGSRDTHKTPIPRQ